MIDRALRSLLPEEVRHAPESIDEIHEGIAVGSFKGIIEDHLKGSGTAALKRKPTLDGPSELAHLRRQALESKKLAQPDRAIQLKP